jgi:hypothetical protein
MPLTSANFLMTFIKGHHLCGHIVCMRVQIQEDELVCLPSCTASCLRVGKETSGTLSCPPWTAPSHLQGVQQTRTRRGDVGCTDVGPGPRPRTIMSTSTLHRPPGRVWHAIGISCLSGHTLRYHPFLHTDSSLGVHSTSSDPHGRKDALQRVLWSDRRLHLALVELLLPDCDCLGYPRPRPGQEHPTAEP